MGRLEGRGGSEESSGGVAVYGRNLLALLGENGVRREALSVFFLKVHKIPMAPLCWGRKIPNRR